MRVQEITVAHSPDSDDAFMFYALATGKVGSPEFHFTHELKDIETLNQAALEGRYAVTAVSIHAYAHLHRRYALLSSGASMGEGYGPVVVAREALTGAQLAGRIVAVPGERTSAFLALKLFQPDVRHRVVPFDSIMEVVAQGEVDAGVVIHEAQLTFRQRGLHRVVDLGEWWGEETGLPLPLGGNAIRRDLGPARERISLLLRQSIAYALENREEALQYALNFARGLDPSQAGRFVEMYVNQRTLDYGPQGRQAVQLFLDRGFQAGLLPERVKVDFV